MLLVVHLCIFLFITISVCQFDLSNEIKWDIFLSVNTTVWMHHMDANEILGEKAKS